ncbi:hypothetical protein Poli38472_012693 [Pythium oligandrum]|uniref:Rap-GAP domain-containing protein n=1 Tax=Pythium oligandrum TaxID=41045 RepID=A0A8K1FJ74_PYTOL|nr:hypothetical protein Poli38472_012693 [Pythium oligandrum]|eukprot:TMW61502.1 hypothetical protein Poli38472_012693 [Pythium oligandrum]
MESRRGGDPKALRKDAEIKRLAKFYAVDRPPRKRLRTLLDFLKNPTGNAPSDGNLVGTVQQLLAGASKEAANGADNSAILNEFWGDMNNCSMVFDVLSDCVTELETLYVPHENAFRRRKKTLEAEDWNEVFEGLEVLIRNNVPNIHDGWKNHGFTLLFSKLLKRDNHALIKKYAFRCLALFTDATRNLQQLVSVGPLSGSPSRSTVSNLTDDAAMDDEDASSRGTSGSRRNTLHLELLRESVDFSPYGGGNILLPDKFINQGVHVEGWIRATPTQAEEPVDMLKFIMDLSLEREDPKITSTMKSSAKMRGDRFEYWTELIMRFYMPLLYPKICIKAKLKEEGDNMGFFHHCPGSFQRVVARWIYKLRSKSECMEILWSRREFAEVIMETVRQRFAYRDNELVLDAIKFYSAICTGGQYIPMGMQTQIHETSRSMISHVSQLFHPSVQLDDPKILVHCIELLEVIAQRPLDEYSSTYLRKFVISTIDNCTTLREPGNTAILSAMVSVVIHVWMHAAIVSKATGQQVWLELTIAIRRWLLNASDAKSLGPELINCWKREVRFASCLLMYVMDEGQSMLKVTPEGAVILPHSGSDGKDNASKDGGVKQGYIQSAANFLMGKVTDVSDATVLLDRVLHLIPPPTVSSLPPNLHLSLVEGMLQLNELWIDSAISSQRTMPTVLHGISPSTVLALFGEWFLPACELDSPDFQNSRCVAIVTLCKLCSVRCANSLTRMHLTSLARILFQGIMSPAGVVVSTVLQRAAPIFTLNLDGMNALVPAFLYVVDQIIVQNIWERAQQSKVKSSNWNRELSASLGIVFSILALPKRYPQENFVNWRQKIAQTSISEPQFEKFRAALEEIPEIDDNFYVIVGRVLVRIASLPFTDIVAIKKRALWGLYSLIVMHLSPATSTLVDRSHLSDWIVQILDFCYSLDFSVSMTALSILQDLSDFHSQVHDMEPVLVPRIIMTLAVFAQQQVEEASVEVQSAMEKQGNAAEGHSSITGDKTSMTGSSRGSRVPSLRDSEIEEEGKGKTKTPGKSNTPTPPQSTSPNGGQKKDQDIPALRLIVQKTAAIFECLRFWVMHRVEVLQDADVKKILFTAIEAALVGSLPDGEWQREVERARAQQRRMSLPMLFLGLQMRASLDNEASQSWLKWFEETSMAAEGLLMHLLHHINGFPTPAGVDQMVSTCSELRDGDDLANGDGAAETDPNAPASLSFVFMDSMIFTLVGSLDSPCVRYIVRDMTGLFTWEIMPAATGITTQRRTKKAMSIQQEAVKERELLVAGDGGNSRGLEQFHLHRAVASVRVELKAAANDNAASYCQTCGGEKPRSAPADPANTLGSKLEVLQVSKPREEAILSNSVCNSRSNYVFHEEDDSAAAKGNAEAGDKKKAGAGSGASVESDKMPMSGGGNRDERQERLDRIAKQYEERNNISAVVVTPVQPTKPVIRRCDCQRRSANGNAISICGLFDMDEREPNIGNLDDERCLLDLVLDSVPMVFRDCAGDTTDKTLLGGRYAMLKYNHMDMEDGTNPLVNDSAEIAGFSFLQRLIHDEECYAQLKAFLLKENNGPQGKDLAEFCDAVKRFERAMVPSDRLGQACAIFWEFFSADGGRSIQFPATITLDIQDQIQRVQKALKVGQSDQWGISGLVFQPAMSHVEHEYFELSGLLDRYVVSLEQPAQTNGSDVKSNGNASAPTAIPSQLALFDAFSIMELNARISHLALTYRSVDELQLTLSRPKPFHMTTMEDPSMRVGALDVCRMFLAQSSMLPSSTGDAMMRRRFKLLENGSKLERSLKHLDKSPVRETMKIGVIYVGLKQRSQQEILRNDRGSKAYERFIKQLGWEIDLLSHRGFIGGLDSNPRSLSNGRTSLYYATAHSEVMFHVVTKMPTKPTDPQQIDKKRHVGNDYVHIVWSENDAHDYDPSTITSHFNDVQLVIYPLRRSQRGLYLVKVHSKDKVPPFGPIQSGMVIPEADLVSLVRQTAMNANRVCRSQTMVYVRPYPTRKKLVDEIVERYAIEYQESQLLSMLFANPSSSAPQSNA